MSDFPDPTPPPSLAPALLDTLLLARRLRNENRDLRDALHCAVNLLREKDHALDAARRAQFNQAAA